MSAILPKDILGIVEIWLSNENDQLKSLSSVGGGCINQAIKITTSKGRYFLKWNDKQSYPKMFAKEEKGLKHLLQTKTIEIPQPLFSGEGNTHSFLLMEWIESGKRNSNFWSDAGTQLSELHRNTGKMYGLDYDNYIGSLPQFNGYMDSWNTFFIERRLEPQLKIWGQSTHFERTVIKNFERLFIRLEQIFPNEPPSLLHGDLWSGNIMTGTSGGPCILDPAVYFGHREIEIAYTQLFGAFDPDFYASYNELWPLERGFNERIDLYNLYPLLVHVNLFGRAYIEQVKQIVKRF